MKFIIQIIAIALIGYLLEIFLPWWSIAIAAFIGGYVLPSRANFLAGLVAIALLWFIGAWASDAYATAPLVEKVAALFKLGKPGMFGVTMLLGGLVGGFAALTGALLNNKRERPYYY